MTERICSVPGCGNPHKGRGFCNKHLIRWRKYGDPHTHLNARDVADRFWEKVDQSADCWLWTATIGIYGYGKFHMEGRPHDAHRVAWLLTHGAVPEDLQLDHLCRNRVCVNPAHLEPVSQRENILRGTAPTALNAAKTHCIHGHELSGANVYHRKDRAGRRQCRECSRIAKRKRPLAS